MSNKLRGIYSEKTHSIRWGNMEFRVPDKYFGDFEEGQEVLFDGTRAGKRDGKYCLARSIEKTIQR